MKLRKITAVSEDILKIGKIYNDSFPKEERMPFYLMAVKAHLDCVDFRGIYDDGVLVGMVYVVRYEKLAYIFYFAIDERFRGRGYGTATIRALRKLYKDYKLFLALERDDSTAENYAERVSRHRFYERAGLVDQPYHICEAGIMFDVMCNGKAVEPHEYKMLMENYCGKMTVEKFGIRMTE